MSIQRPRRWLYWLGLLVAIVILGFAAFAFLTPPDTPPETLIWPSSILGTTYRADGVVGTVTLTHHDGRWEGDVQDFLIGTATHFAPDTDHGFFVVHLTDGRFIALTDRSAHRGQRVYWHDPLPSYAGRWTIPGFVEPSASSYYATNGDVLSGPAPRPLDPFPLTINGDRLSIADRADCPPEGPGPRLWCSDPRI